MAVDSVPTVEDSIRVALDNLALVTVLLHGLGQTTDSRGDSMDARGFVRTTDLCSEAYHCLDRIQKALPFEALALPANERQPAEVVQR